MPNAWVIHVKKWSAAHNKAYGCAISDPDCRSSYKKPEKIEKSLNKDLNILEKEADLKNFEKSYYHGLNLTHLNSSGRRTKFSKAENPQEYQRKYNNLKEILEKQTGKNYPILQTPDKLKKEFTKELKKQNSNQILTSATNQTEIYKSPYKKKSGLLY